MNVSVCVCALVDCKAGLCKGSTHDWLSHLVIKSGATCQRMHLKTHLRPKSLSLISISSVLLFEFT